MRWPTSLLPPSVVSSPATVTSCLRIHEGAVNVPWLAPCLAVLICFDSKRKGLDKALFQIEQALKRARSGEQSREESKALNDLQHLLDSDGRSATSAGTPRSKRRNVGDQEDDSSGDDDDDYDYDYEATDDTPGSSAYMFQHRDGSLTVDDAENPLQLLARASNLQLSPTPGGGPSPSQSIRPSRRNPLREQLDEDAEIQDFFTSVRVSLDVGSDIDPISMGLVTDAEAEELFD